MTNSTITFHNAHIPILEDGKYDVTVSQSVNSEFQAEIKDQQLTFHVDGPRFQLEPGQVVSVYPPSAGRGSYEGVLPILVLKRSTLPWERTPFKENIESDDSTGSSAVQNSAWLFLLLVDESESEKVKECVSPIFQASPATTDCAVVSTTNSVDKPQLTEIAKRLSVDKQNKHSLPKSLNYLEVDESLLIGNEPSLIPNTLDELKYLSYTRIKNVTGISTGTGTGGAKKDVSKAAEEHSVLLCNRVPKQGSSSTVYLISLEDNYEISSDTKADNFVGIRKSLSKPLTKNTNDTLASMGKNPYIFSYLHKWQFHNFDDQLYCITKDKLKNINTQLGLDEKSTKFTSLLDHTFTTKEAFETALKASPVSVIDVAQLNTIERVAKIPGTNFHELLSNLDGGISALAHSSSSAGIESTGSLNLPYSSSAGKAYYRSPFTAKPISLSAFQQFSFQLDHFPSHSSDLALSELNDVTYSAAFELGRLTALDDVDFGKEFFKWKTEYAMATRSKALNKAMNTSHLAVSDMLLVPEIPEHVKSKFTNWQQLKGIPYRYLIPDSSLLPDESIRYFQVDHYWVNSFICGAFSIGHTIDIDFSSELSRLMLDVSAVSYGFLINSFVVSAWPGFEVDAKQSADDDVSLDVLRREKLDMNVELFLYPRQFHLLNFHLHQGKSYSGFLVEEVGDKTQWMKKNYFKGGEDSKEGVTFTTGSDENHHVFFDETVNNVIDIQKVVKGLNASSIAGFASKMLEGTPHVVFSVT